MKIGRVTGLLSLPRSHSLGLPTSQDNPRAGGAAPFAKGELIAAPPEHFLLLFRTLKGFPISRKVQNPMNQLLTPGKTLLSLLLLSTTILQANAQSPKSMALPDELVRTVTSLDSALFEAYNQCDLEKFGTFFIDDVEFYHDQGGVTLGRQNLTESVKKNICGKVRRELVPETLEVYPMRGYGAVEMGVHRFHQPKVDSNKPVGEAKFVHLWQNKEGVWRITRVISYDHRSLK